MTATIARATPITSPALINHRVDDDKDILTSSSSSSSTTTTIRGGRRHPIVIDSVPSPSSTLTHHHHHHHHATSILDMHRIQCIIKQASNTINHTSLHHHHHHHQTVLTDKAIIRASRQLVRALIFAESHNLSFDAGCKGVRQLIDLTQQTCIDVTHHHHHHHHTSRVNIPSSLRLNKAIVTALNTALITMSESSLTTLIGRVEQRRDGQGGVGREATTKMVIDFGNDVRVESVIIRQRHWATLCVSSQVGCTKGCRFCATGTMRSATNLNVAQILEQLVYARRIEPNIRNVVFMGMGEPLDNYSCVRSAVRSMIDSQLFGLAPRHVCVSTVGVVPNMLRFAIDLPGVNLALSLHAPTQSLRQSIVPSASLYPIDTLMNALDIHLKHVKAKRRRVLIECIVIKNVNDSFETIRDLGTLLRINERHQRVTVNLIPYNPTYVKQSFEAPTAERVHDLQMTLVNEFDVRCYTRKEHGQEVAAACGQLVLETSKQRRKRHAHDDDIEDLIKPPSSSLSSSSSSSSLTTSTSSSSSIKTYVASETSSSNFNRGPRTSKLSGNDVSSYSITHGLREWLMLFSALALFMFAILLEYWRRYDNVFTDIGVGVDIV